MNIVSGNIKWNIPDINFKANLEDWKDTTLETK